MARQYKPFSITARAFGHPRKLYTPVTVVNLEADSCIAAATVNGMWDTGAEVCLISRDLAARLGCRFSRAITAAGIGGEVSAPTGFVYLSLLANGQLVDTIASVVDQTSPTDEYSFIFGMDFIRKGALAISSTAIDTTLSFTIPSPEPIDFTRRSDVDASLLPLSESRETAATLYGPDALALLFRDNPE